MTARSSPVLLVAASFLAGCLSQNAPTPTRYFVPEGPPPADRAAEAQLHLGQVTSPPYLRRPMAWRRSAVELAFDDEAHWASEPRLLVEDALRTALFDGGGFAPTQDLAGPSVAVHLGAFEGSFEPLEACVVLQLHFAPARGHSIESHRIRVRRPLERADAEALARGVGEALVEASTQARDWLAGVSGEADAGPATGPER